MTWSVQLLSRVWLLATPRAAANQASLSIINFWSLLKLLCIESVMPSNHLILCRPLLLLSVFPSISVFSNKSVLPSGGQSIVLQFQHQSFQWIFRVNFLYNWLVWSCSPRDSQESSPTPQLKNVNSLVLSFLYDTTLTSIHDYWKNHSFDYRDLCRQSQVSAF